MTVLLPIFGAVIALGVMMLLALEAGERELRAIETRLELQEAWEADEAFAAIAYESERLRDRVDA